MEIYFATLSFELDEIWYLVALNILQLTASKFMSAKFISNANINSSVFNGQTNGLFNFALLAYSYNKHDWFTIRVDCTKVLEPQHLQKQHSCLNLILRLTILFACKLHNFCMIVFGNRCFPNI